MHKSPAIAKSKKGKMYVGSPHMQRGGFHISNPCTLGYIGATLLLRDDSCSSLLYNYYILYISDFVYVIAQMDHNI